MLLKKIQKYHFYEQIGQILFQESRVNTSHMLSFLSMSKKSIVLVFLSLSAIKFSSLFQMKLCAMAELERV